MILCTLDHYARLGKGRGFSSRRVKRGLFSSALTRVLLVGLSTSDLFAGLRYFTIKLPPGAVLPKSNIFSNFNGSGRWCCVATYKGITTCVKCEDEFRIKDSVKESREISG